MDPFGWSPEQYSAAASWVSAIAGAATFLVVTATAIYAARQFKETKELRRDQSRPYVVPAINIEQQIMFVLTVENVGKSPAFDVTLAFDPPPRSELKDLESLVMLKEPIPTMPPGQRFRAYWESALTVFSKKHPYQHPMSYRVTVAYRDHHQNVYGPEEYVLDFRIFGGQALAQKGLPELVRAVERLSS